MFGDVKLLLHWNHNEISKENDMSETETLNKSSERGLRRKSESFTDLWVSGRKCHFNYKLKHNKNASKADLKAK